MFVSLLVIVLTYRYGAIAYSPKVGEYGYGWNHFSRAAAERTALAQCKAEDAKVLT